MPGRKPLTDEKSLGGSKHATNEPIDDAINDEQPNGPANAIGPSSDAADHSEQPDALADDITKSAARSHAEQP